MQLRFRRPGLFDICWLVGLSSMFWIAPALADRMALWNIVHGRCAPHAEAGEAPAPCLELVRAEGDAVLKDLNGVAQLLLIPTARVTGIEDPRVLADDTPNYFAAAWRARADMVRYLKTTPAREAIGLAINSKYARSQDQLHIHVDCLEPQIEKALADYAPSLDQTWRRMTIALDGRTYWARRVDSADLDGVLPFRLLADGLPEAKADMGSWTLMAAPLQFDGRLVFALLADRYEGGGGHAEDLQDHACAVVATH